MHTYLCLPLKKNSMSSFRIYLAFTISLLCFFPVSGQLKFFGAPVTIPVSLSGNFAELRNNHFHMGIDIRTQQRTGIPICASAEGHISRIVVSPSGYGLAAYIEHPNRTTTQYGHLLRFRPDIEEYVKSEQYRRESYSVDLIVPADKFPLTKGEVFAFSGNSGSSGGPHLHFEIRDTRTEEALNPLLFNDFGVTDKTSPKIWAIQFYPLGENSHVEMQNSGKSFSTTAKGNEYLIVNNPVVRAMGKIGIAIRATEYFDGSTSPCGIYSSELRINGNTIFHYKFDRMAFSQTRFINSYIDYETYIEKGTRYQKHWRDPGNDLPVYENESHRGIFSVDTGKVYNGEIIVSDVAGNQARLTFTLKGAYREANRVKDENPLFRHNDSNKLETEDFRLNAPEGAFYDDFHFHYAKLPRQPGFYSPVHQVHYHTTPIQKPVRISIRPEGLPESLIQHSFIASVDMGGSKKFAGGKYNEGWFEADIQDFGRYAVTCDTIPPRISSLSIKGNALTESAQIRFNISDGLSGIKTYRGEIDGKYALFEYDQKSNLITYRIDKTRMSIGMRHTLRLTVTDRANNVSTFQATFWK